MATRSSSGWVAFISMRFIILSYCLVRDKQQKHRIGDEQLLCKKAGQQKSDSG
jgi:hypothetical protein